MDTAPIQQQSIIGLLLRALFIHIMNITLLLLSGGSIQVLSTAVAVHRVPGFRGSKGTEGS